MDLNKQNGNAPVSNNEEVDNSMDSAQRFWIVMAFIILIGVLGIVCSVVFGIYSSNKFAQERVTQLLQSINEEKDPKTKADLADQLYVLQVSSAMSSSDERQHLHEQMVMRQILRASGQRIDPLVLPK